MTPISTTCPHCTSTTSAPDHYLHLPITCPTCYHTYTLTATTPRPNPRPNPNTKNHQKQKPHPKQKFCTHCHTTSTPITITPGSFAIELILWLLLLIPGIIYSTWRLTTRHPACPDCKTKNPIPTSSPAAQTHL